MPERALEQSSAHPASAVQRGRRGERDGGGKLVRRRGWRGPCRRAEEEGRAAMGFTQTNATIPVEMAVTRYREFPEERMLDVWGYVGDYEVCVHLPLDDDRARQLLGQPRPPRSNRTSKRT